ncbi:L-fuculose kinase [Duganella sp. FT80W]|uniref:L-fuculose kinase n=1 Tax=Duganella guangzhouensis TaxID=2666084 RepID=A0A6I2L1M2_9BURK|nr:FGGY family carbohydrate kinase [Duganella guangzhouensis]MRW92071.1 L-fuculose kinase [Duganella guangzhouensis]
MVLPVTAVLDIGKTNVKLSLVDQRGRVVHEARTPNTVLEAAPYPQHDVERIWTWFLGALAEAGTEQGWQVRAIVPVTHGATAVLLKGDALALPVLDYECERPYAEAREYEVARPLFSESLSPSLPNGLNLGRQLYWQQQQWPQEFGAATTVLMYAQYWAWRLCGVAASEVTSLGCHTDLWNPKRGDFSSMVDKQGWRHLFPPLRAAGDVLGTIHPHLAAQTGLPADCQVVCGIHDSNASLLRYLGADAPTVISTGTWVIVAAPGFAPERLGELDAGADMLANVSAFGQPVACQRFMGGREFAELAGEQIEEGDQYDLQRVISQGSMALPTFSPHGGPFQRRIGKLVGPPLAGGRERYALASLYCALVTDHCLSRLGSRGPIVIEGSFTANRLYAGLLAWLRPEQRVMVSDDSSGTVHGGWLLTGQGATGELPWEAVAPLELPAARMYARLWRELVDAGQ